MGVRGVNSFDNSAMKRKSLVEDIGNSKLVTAGVALLATVHPAAALVPALLGSAANTRMQKRIEETLHHINGELHGMGARLDELSDAQYKLVCETVLTIQRTNDAEKLAYLREIALNSVLEADVDIERTYVLSRVIRDISALELKFVLNCLQYEVIGIPAAKAGSGVEDAVQRADFQKYGWHVIEPGEETNNVISGLLSLGLMIDANLMSDAYRFTPLAKELIELVRRGD